MAAILQLPVASDAAAQEFGYDLYIGRQDSCDPESCFVFLQELYPERWREIIANLDGAVYFAGQLYIDAEMRRAC